jgi:hypothetical protein
VVNDQSKVVRKRFDGKVRADASERFVVVVLGEDEADVVLSLDAEVLCGNRLGHAGEVETASEGKGENGDRRVWERW